MRSYLDLLNRNIQTSSRFGNSGKYPPFQVDLFPGILLISPQTLSPSDIRSRSSLAVGVFIYCRLSDFESRFISVCCMLHWTLIPFSRSDLALWWSLSYSLLTLPVIAVLRSLDPTLGTSSTFWLPPSEFLVFLWI